MDELTLLARALPDAPPPSAEVVERARARLAAAREEPVRPSRSGRRDRLVWAWTLGTAMATAAVVMAVVTLVSSLAPVPAPAVVPAGGNEALLRLADEVAKLPDDRGAYWRRPLLNNGLIRVKAGDKAFNVLSSSRIDLWQPRDVRDPVHVERWEQFVRPATPADERAWRAAGAPSTVQRVCTPGTPAGDCKKIRMRSKPSDCLYTHAAEPGGVLGDRRLGELTLADLTALPGDAALLRERLRAYWKAGGGGMVRESFEKYLSRSWVLLELPVSPSVRAAALRLLAGLPTAKVRGSVTDPMGRQGLAVTFVKSEGFTADFGADEVAERYVTILHPRTGAVLAANVSIAAESAEGLAQGTVMHYQAWAPEAGWTDERPERPRGCRLSDRPIP
ncbi:CU044_5270 family protein [Nonomuraea recticatena]|uniref:CU044_5270 family protein n=1 Tax=Nonomuraea recticatena TaxID=46178 RepID=A0ABN3RK15_9ACTN